jgi:phenylpropionate dioxygenase-like ring-hydroxylating dioxygenase large terminal subunit
MSVQEVKVSSKLSEAATLPYRLYVDPKILEKENDMVFSRTWQYVGHVSQVKKPGDFFTCEVAGEPIIVIRGQDEELRAFYNVCPHRATKVEKNEQGNKKILQCSYHGWTFNLNGDLHKAPNFQDAENFCSQDVCLNPVRLETQETLIFINLDENALPLISVYGSFLEDLRRFEFLGELKKVRVNNLIIKANWKAVIDNYLECDHCPIAHPGFVNTLDMSQYKIVTCENFSYQGSSIKPNRNFGTVDLNKAEVQGGRFYWLWPNLMLSVYPGSGNMTTSQIVPIDHETTLAIYTYYFKDENLTAEHEELMKFVDQVRNEDVELVEVAQVGFRSRAFRQGRFSPTEQGMHQFHLLLQDALEMG